MDFEHGWPRKPADSCSRGDAQKGGDVLHLLTIKLSRSWLMTVSLRGSRDFQKVYQKGKRYQGVLITAFVLPNRLSHNRFGVTASRKAIGNAVQRNRARRLLKEAFRLKRSSLSGLHDKYDWVLNAKRSLPGLKVQAALDDFEKLISRVAEEESKPRTFG
jgi:ribonuclease P protein component